ncbi:gamma-glutamyl-gamma-aminobutyrate hydrolase family protein [Paludifilum halophilum]|uniref:Gamma-glutamyl-gamma-aminobutyrate hydrolase n=1 Tax=Paludifilum halophilum TaxID=1642702 RepID=A0A235B657_9BACL|nr:gamma-glutamyl-gamma-aminobutyrate hydrolase family protein [Paludifilum halophilum]OYD07784.1 gamma-glutamyl-gamma-aminobutyrate hydrolase [Paludifilum halophilum]
MFPAIGVTVSTREESVMALNRDHTDAVFRAGGIPLMLPYTLVPEQLQATADRIDGLLLTGGDDIDPGLFGEEPIPGLGPVEPERDRMEIALSRKMMEAGKPILAVCRGCQILNIAAGGDMYQDLNAQREKGLQHAQKAPRSHPSHSVHVKEDTRLHAMVGGSEYRVNSFHHQAVRRLADGFMVSATASDGVIEAFESLHHPFVMGVQWHPENMPSDSVARQLFTSLVAACRQ